MGQSITVRVARGEGSNLTPEQQRIEALNQQARDRWYDAAWQHEQANILTTLTLEQFEYIRAVDLMFNVQTVGYYDRITVRERRGLRAHWVARGGYVEMSELREDAIDLPRDQLGAHVGEFRDKLIGDYAVTQADLISLGAVRADAEINRRALALLRAAVPGTSHPSYIESPTVDLTLINSAIDDVYEQARTRRGAASGSMGVVVAGRRSAVQQIPDKLMLNTDGKPVAFLPESNEEMLARGMIGKYRGASLVAIENFVDDEDVPFWPENEMFIFSQNAGTVGFFGGMETRSWEEDATPYWHSLFRQDVGMLVTYPERIRRYILTA
jgi:hypothetical protein